MPRVVIGCLDHLEQVRPPQPQLISRTRVVSSYRLIQRGLTPFLPYLVSPFTVIAPYVDIGEIISDHGS